MKKLILSALTATLFANLTGCIAIAKHIKEQQELAVAECDKFPKLAGHRFTYCPNTHYAIAKKGIGQYTLMKPTGEITTYYDDIRFSQRIKDEFYFNIQRGKQSGVMNLDGKVILLLDNYTGNISYEYAKGFAICGAFGSIGDTGYKKVCYDKNGNRAKQYEVN